MTANISLRIARLAAWAIATVTALSPAIASAAEPETLETVLAVWRKREAATKSVKVVIDEEYRQAHQVDLEGREHGGTSKMRRELVLDGTNMRHERVGELWAPGLEKADHLTMFAVIDGDCAKKLDWIHRGGKVIHANGYIRTTERHTDVNNIYLSPILRHYRPLSPRFSRFKVDELKIVSTEEKIGGVRCLLLQEPYGLPGGVRRYWVAPDQEMAVVRMVASRGDTLIHQVDVTFKIEPKKGWGPASWKGTKFINGKINTSATASVSELEVNPPIAASSFDIDFPPGTEVWDDIAKRKFIVKPQELAIPRSKNR